MKNEAQIGDLQLEIMKVLWELGEATVTDVQRALKLGKPLAQTTVATMLVRMEKRGLVAHRAEGRKFIYAPAVKEDEIRRSMVDRLTDSLFSGSVASLVAHLLDEHCATPEELEEVKKMLAGRGGGKKPGGRG